MKRVRALLRRAQHACIVEIEVKELASMHPGRCEARCRHRKMTFERGENVAVSTDG